MPELTHRFHRQPSLLDRLADGKGYGTAGDPERITLARLEEIVMRDIERLLNVVRLDATCNLDAYPRVRESVLNFGMADLVGRSIEELDGGHLQSAIARAIRTFEPRLAPDSIRVEPRSREDASPAARTGHSRIFVITGDLRADAEPRRVMIHTEIDVETGVARVHDAGGGP